MKTVCLHCKTPDSPLWRKGPRGSTLCNACGLHFARFGSHRALAVRPSPEKKARAKPKAKKKALIAVLEMQPPKPKAKRQPPTTTQVVCQTCQRTRVLPSAVRTKSLAPDWTCASYPLREFAHCFVSASHWSRDGDLDASPSGTSSEHTDDKPTAEDRPSSELSSAEINVDAWAPFRTYALNLARMTRDAYSGTSREHSWRFGELLFELMTLQVVPEAGAKWAPAELLYDAGFVRRVQELFGKDSREVGILQSIMNLLRQCFARAPAQRPTVDQILATVQAW